MMSVVGQPSRRTAHLLKPHLQVDGAAQLSEPPVPRSANLGDACD